MCQIWGFKSTNIFGNIESGGVTATNANKRKVFFCTLTILVIKRRNFCDLNLISKKNIEIVIDIVLKSITNQWEVDK